MTVPFSEVAADFKDALQDLKSNSRPEISNLTIIAKENTEQAQAISSALETHIRTVRSCIPETLNMSRKPCDADMFVQTRPEWKLPALYVLDSIVKNVGTPYTVYLSRDLYRTFMEAYSLVDENTRKSMEALLRTWKQPVPESMDPRPVFSPEVTRDIENTLIKYRTAAVQAQRPMGSMPGRAAQNGPWRNTPTPPQNLARFPPANDPRMRQVCLLDIQEFTVP
jgi:pre-mRNA cleavage complex 2 protein Pcf11